MSFRVVGLLGSSAAGALLLTALHVPAGGLFGAVLGSGVFSWIASSGPLPEPYRFAGLALIGTIAGSAVQPDLWSVLARLALPVAVATALLLAVWLSLTWFLVRTTGLDRPTALLSTVPGGLSVIFAIVGETRADLQTVLAVHLVRVLVVVILGVPVLGAFLHLFR